MRTALVAMLGGIVFGLAYGRELARCGEERPIVTISAEIADDAPHACQGRTADPDATWEFIQINDTGHILSVTCKEAANE